MNRPKGFTLYQSSAQLLSMLPPEEAGLAIQAACRFFRDGTEPDDLPLSARLVFASLQEGIAEGFANYQRVCERNKKNRNGSGSASSDAQRSKKATSGHHSSPVETSGDNRVESNQTESNQTELKNERRTPKRFEIPSLEEVSAYCTARNNSVNPERFIDYYTSNGWKVGKNQMKDWKAAVRTWEQRESNSKETASGYNGFSDADNLDDLF